MGMNTARTSNYATVLNSAGEKPMVYVTFDAMFYNGNRVRQLKDLEAQLGF